MSIRLVYGGRRRLSEFVEVRDPRDQGGNHVFEGCRIKQVVVREECQNYVPILQVITTFARREKLVPASFA